MGLFDRLFGGKPSVEPPSDPRVCTAALMVEAALADGIYANVEEARIRKVLRETFELDEAQCEKVIDAAEQLAEESADHHRFTRVVKTLPLEERERIIGAMWRIVFADQEESPFEEAFVRKIADLIGVDPMKARLARRDAQAEGGDAV